MRNFKELKVWHKSHELTVRIYQATRSFPREELYGLTSQIRRACASIPANIAEGCGRSSVLELGHFLNVAMGSASELEYHLLLARDLNFLLQPEYENLATNLSEVQRMLAAYIQKIKQEHKS